VLNDQYYCVDCWDKENAKMMAKLRYSDDYTASRRPPQPSTDFNRRSGGFDDRGRDFKNKLLPIFDTIMNEFLDLVMQARTATTLEELSRLTRLTKRLKEVSCRLQYGRRSYWR
jgi:hypothetical protein